MFTGLVEGRGTIADIRSDGPAIRLTLEAPAELLPEAESGGSATAPAGIGDSISINGCCLTLVEIAGSRWSFQAGAETLSKTNLGRLRAGDPVNLERSLPVNGRLGGHFVQGHVDGVGAVAEIVRNGEWIDMWFSAPSSLTALMTPKGSIAVDGISLTLVHVERERFSVSLIPHTLDVTTLGVRNVGDVVNIETDILGKYVHQLMTGERGTAGY